MNSLVTGPGGLMRRLRNRDKDSDKDFSIENLKRHLSNVIPQLKSASISLQGLKPYAQQAGKALAIGTGAAIPLALTGSYLSDKLTTDARNKALQAGAGIAALNFGSSIAANQMNRLGSSSRRGQ